MTLFIADIAIYQGSLTVDQLKAAGFGAVNLKVSHGITNRNRHPDAAGWVSRARAAGLGIATFHWLDNTASGTAQAEYAFREMQRLGVTAGHFAHVVDTESDATEAIYQDYVRTMAGLLGRPIATYTGDWWWQPRNWTRRTPWLHAAPNAGYLGTYPGDASPHWRAGYSGWDDLAVMQYGVNPVAGVDVSMSAIRDLRIWKAMTGEDMAWFVVPSLEAMRRELNTVFPNRDKTSDGGIGDTSHNARPSGHNPDETGNPEDQDADNLDEVRARDFDTDLNHAGVTMEDVCQYLLRRIRAGQITWIKYIIYNRRIWRLSNRWVQEDYTGANPHDKHMHVSCRPETVHENNTQSLGLAEMVEELTMPSVQDIVRELRPVIRAEVRDELTVQRPKIAETVGELPVDIETDQPGVNMQPWSRVDAYARDERADILRRVTRLEGEIAALRLSMEELLVRIPAPQPPSVTR